MLLSIDKLLRIWDIKPSGVVHVGAHKGEEANSYEINSWIPVLWIEGQQNLVKELQKTLDPKIHSIHQAFVGSIEGEEKLFNLMSNSQSSSLLELGTHATDYPEITKSKSYKIKTNRIDNIVKNTWVEEYEITSKTGVFLNLDIQGYELEALMSLGSALGVVSYIYTEVNKKEVYKNCARIYEIDEFLGKFGFIRVETRWIMRRGWGDALYIRKSEFKEVAIFKFLPLQKIIVFVRKTFWNLSQLRALIKRKISSSIRR